MRPSMIHSVAVFLHLLVPSTRRNIFGLKAGCPLIWTVTVRLAVPIILRELRVRESLPEEAGAIAAA